MLTTNDQTSEPVERDASPLILRVELVDQTSHTGRHSGCEGQLNHPNILGYGNLLLVSFHDILAVFCSDALSVKKKHDTKLRAAPIPGWLRTGRWGRQ